MFFDAGYLGVVYNKVLRAVLLQGSGLFVGAVASGEKLHTAYGADFTSIFRASFESESRDASIYYLSLFCVLCSTSKRK